MLEFLFLSGELSQRSRFLVSCRNIVVPSSRVGDGHVVRSVRLRQMLLRLVAGAKRYVLILTSASFVSSGGVNFPTKFPCVSSGELNILTK